MNKKVKSEEELKAEGKCPYSGEACRHVRMCIMTKIDACYRLVANIENRCYKCRKSGKGCRWVCFRQYKGEWDAELG
jgi:hypothetical protein